MRALLAAVCTAACLLVLCASATDDITRHMTMNCASDDAIRSFCVPQKAAFTCKGAFAVVDGECKQGNVCCGHVEGHHHGMKRDAETNVEAGYEEEELTREGVHNATHHRRQHHGEASEPAWVRKLISIMERIASGERRHHGKSRHHRVKGGRHHRRLHKKSGRHHKKEGRHHRRVGKHHNGDVHRCEKSFHLWRKLVERELKQELHVCEPKSTGHGHGLCLPNADAHAHCDSKHVALLTSANCSTEHVCCARVKQCHDVTGKHHGKASEHHEGRHHGGEHHGQGKHHGKTEHHGQDKHHGQGEHHGQGNHHGKTEHHGQGKHHAKTEHHGQGKHHGKGEHHAQGKHHGKGEHHGTAKHHESKAQVEFDHLLHNVHTPKCNVTQTGYTSKGACVHSFSAMHLCSGRIGVVTGIGCSAGLVCCALNVTAAVHVNGTAIAGYSDLSYQGTQALGASSGSSSSSGLTPLEIGIIAGACFIVLVAAIIIIVVIVRRRNAQQPKFDETETTTTYHRA